MSRPLHPKQVADTEDLHIGEAYALVAESSGAYAVTHAIYAGYVGSSSADDVASYLAFAGGFSDLLYLVLQPQANGGSGGSWRIQPPGDPVSYALYKGGAPHHVPGFPHLGDVGYLWAGGRRAVVPLPDWESDPRLAPGGGWVEEEAKLRARRDDALRRALGF